LRAGQERRYVLDTNIFIQAASDAIWQEKLERFHAAFAPFEVLSAVVAQELLAGVKGRAAKTLHSKVLEPFERRGRVIAPSYSAWKETGNVLSTLVSSGRTSWPAVSRSFVNDVLLAMSCRESGVVLVTENVRDFARIAAVRQFDFVAPWPNPIA
jgi:predicted nucleic acid-binding protein